MPAVSLKDSLLLKTGLALIAAGLFGQFVAIHGGYMQKHVDPEIWAIFVHHLSAACLATGLVFGAMHYSASARARLHFSGKAAATKPARKVLAQVFSTTLLQDSRRAHARKARSRKARTSGRASSGGKAS